LLKERVVCRPGGVGWFLGILCGALGGLFLALPWLPDAANRPLTADAYWLMGIGTTFFLGLAGLGIVSETRFRVEADENGLRKRWFGKWKSARWDEVRDFYEKPSPKTNTKSLVIQTDTERFFVSGQWKNLPALREIVARKVTGAPVSLWAERGKRDDERRPLIFAYDTLDNRLVSRIMTTCMFGMIGCYLGLLWEQWPGLVSTFRIMGVLSLLADLGIFALFSLPSLCL
jgi:hypothetical protein